jgi:hypothetical protein
MARPLFSSISFSLSPLALLVALTCHASNTPSQAAVSHKAPSKASLPSAAVTKKAPVQASVIPQQWQEYFEIPMAPARTVYFGGNKEISHDPKDPSSEHAHFVVWGKFVYHDPQKVADKTYVTELVGVHIDCPNQTYSQFRDIKLDEKEVVVADSVKAGKFQAIPRNVTLALLDPAAATASGAVSFTCGMDED